MARRGGGQVVSGGATYPGPSLTDKGSGPRKAKPKKLKTNRYNNAQQTSGGVKRRAQRRLKATGPVAGVNAKDGITGGEARRIRSDWIGAGKPKPKRNAKRRNATPGTRGWDPLQPLTGPSMRREVNAEAKLQYGPQFNQLDSERRISDQQSTNLQGWYKDYQAKVEQSAAQQAAYTKGFQDSAYSQANTAAATDTAQNQQLAQQQGQSAAIRGTTVGPQVAQTAQAGVAARQAQGTAMGGVLAAQGQAQTGYLQGKVGTAAGEAVQAQVDEQRRRGKIEQLSRELKSEMGQFKVKARGELRDTERKYALERQAFGLDVQKAANDQANTRADNRRQARSDRALNRDRQADNQRMNAADSERARHNRQLEAEADARNNKGGPSSFTPKQVRDNRVKLQNGQGIANDHSGKGYQGLVQDMVDAGYDREMARVIALRATGQDVPKPLLRRFHRQYGFVPKHKGQHRSPSATPRNPDGTPG